MQLKYILGLATFVMLNIKAAAQNTPVLSQTSPSGGGYTYTQPPESQLASTTHYTLFSYAPLVPITDPASINESSPTDAVKQQVTYYDGYERPFQTIVRNNANVNSVPKHLVQLSDNRPIPDHYNFLPYASNSPQVDPSAYQNQNNYYSNLFPNEGYSSFSRTVNTSSTTERSISIYSPGKGQVGSQFGSKTVAITNAASEVIIWDVDGNGVPYANGYYTAGSLNGVKVMAPTYTGSNTSLISALSKEYTDRDGKTIVKIVADSNNSVTNQPPVQTYAYTYYVYDEKGNLKCTITPKAYKYYLSQGSISPTILNNLCFQYQYDAKGRICGIKKPGENDCTYIVFDRKNRPIMRQTPNEKIANEWEVSFFDGLNRPKVTSIYHDAAGLDHNAWQNNIDTWATGGAYADLLNYLVAPSMEPQYPVSNHPVDDPDNNAGNVITSNTNTIMTINYYDDYAHLDPNNTLFNECQNTVALTLLGTTGSETPIQSTRTYGMATGSIVRILRSPTASASKVGDWRTSLSFYDDKGRVINSKSFVTDNTTTHSVINTDYAGIQYDFSGRVLTSGHIFTNTNSTHNALGIAHREYIKNQYDAVSGALLKTVHSVDGNAWATIATYLYDDLGRLKRKTLGAGGEVQEMDYNIRGQLSAINGLYAETANKGGFSKSFGESLKYDYGFTKPRYDGKLSGMVWRGSTATDMYAYGYDYTQNGALKQADFSHQESGAWNRTIMDYSVSNLFYDKNGNMLSMKQRGVKPGTGPVDMDVLTYTYESGDISNRLSEVKDASSVTDFGAGDFQGTAENTYDPNGNIATDAGAKNISLVTYTRFNKPVSVHFTNNSIMEYSYDALGNKVEELMIDPEHAARKRTDYIGNCVYVNSYDNSGGDGNGTDSLQYIVTSEGRTTFNFSTLVPVEEYFVKDHLGNIRSVVNVSNYDLHRYLATYELASAHLEDLIFDNIEDIRDTRPGGDGDNTMAANLNGGDPNRTIGTSILLHVMAGDKVSLNVSNYYNGYDAQQDQPLEASTVMNQIISTLTGGEGGLGGSESHNTKIVQEVFNSSNYDLYNQMIQDNTDASKPKAYLNYVLFDERMQVVKEMAGAFQATGDGNWTTIGTPSALEIPTNGYLAVYLSNTSANFNCGNCSDVYFDGLNIVLSHGNLLEENHYYPHGLPIFGLGSKTTDLNYRNNRQKYQSNEYITDQDLNWMSFGARQYDPQIGRFLGVDPLADRGGQDMYSPYAAMGNQPQSVVDPNGLFGGPDPHLQVANPDGMSNEASQAFNSAQAFMMSTVGSANIGHGGGTGMFSGSFSYMGMSGLILQSYYHYANDEVKAMISTQYYGDRSYIVNYQNKSNSAGFTTGMTAKDFINSNYVIDREDEYNYYVHYYDADLNRIDQSFLKGDGNYIWSSGNQSTDFWSDFSQKSSQGLWVFGLAATAMSQYGPYNSVALYAQGVRRGVYGNYQLVGRNLTLFKNSAMTKVTEPISEVGRFGTMAGKGVVVVAIAIDAISYYNGSISGYKFATNTVIGLYGLTAVGTPISILYFGVDALYPGGWLGDDKGHPGALKDMDRLYQENKAINPDFQLWPGAMKQ